MFLWWRESPVLPGAHTQIISNETGRGERLVINRISPQHGDIYIEARREIERAGMRDRYTFPSINGFHIKMWMSFFVSVT
jgi:hypothetical protein